MGDALADFFGFEALGTTFKREVVAGVTTFVAMSYIIAVNPAILTAPVAVVVLGFALISVLIVWRVPGAILLGIIGTSIAAFETGVARAPASILGMPPSPAPILMKLDLSAALSWGFFGVLLTI